MKEVIAEKGSHKVAEQRVSPKTNVSKSKLENLKRLLPILGLIVGLFLIMYPFLPGIAFFFQGIGNKPLELPYKSVIAEKVDDGEDFVEIDKPIPLDNTLVIPKISVDIRIIEGNTEDALLRGAWHRPGTGNPIDGGNYVVTGHRFRYVPPNNTTFYSLDKLEKGDLIIVYYEGQEFDYKVEESFIVEPEDLHVEDDLGYDVLTLYTCTPLWTSSKRLVIRALPI